MLELLKLRKDINILFGYIKCLMAESDETSPLVATEWSANHTNATGNPYTAGTYVFYNGHVYKCKFNNDGIIPTNTTYWLDLGEGHLLAEEQSDWNATEGRRFILNKPTNTSNFVNDGEDGSSPYVTQDELVEALEPNYQTLDEVLQQGDTSTIGEPKVKSIGLYDDHSTPFVGFAKVRANKGRFYFEDKLGNLVASFFQGTLNLVKGLYTFTINTPALTNDRTATFQDKSGVIAYLSDVSPVEVSYQVEGGTSGSPPVFNGAPMFSGSYVIVGPLVHFQIQVDMDNITNFGTGQYYVKLPFTSKYGYMFRSGCLHDFSTGTEYHISGHVFAGSDTMELFTSDTQGNSLYDFPFTSTEPVSLDAADNFHIAGTYISDFTSN